MYKVVRVGYMQSEWETKALPETKFSPSCRGELPGQSAPSVPAAPPPREIQHYLQVSYGISNFPYSTQRC